MIYAVIPARYASTRFPGKPLAKIAGKPLIQWVYEKASQAKLIDKVVVATDHKKIYDAVESFGANVVMTSDKHQSGTDRIAEVLQNNTDAKIIVNVQGDEPLIASSSIDNVVKPLMDDPTLKMTTLIRECAALEDLENPHIVKVVTDKDNYALYFSRSCIPHMRTKHLKKHYLHIGIYGYTRETVLMLNQLEQVDIEKIESLEQLRALYHGIRIKTVLTKYTPVGVDTPEDLEKVQYLLKKDHASL